MQEPWKAVPRPAPQHSARAGRRPPRVRHGPAGDTACTNRPATPTRSPPCRRAHIHWAHTGPRRLRRPPRRTSPRSEPRPCRSAPHFPTGTAPRPVLRAPHAPIPPPSAAARPPIGRTRPPRPTSPSPPAAPRSCSSRAAPHGGAGRLRKLPEHADRDRGRHQVERPRQRHGVARPLVVVALAVTGYTPHLERPRRNPRPPQPRHPRVQSHARCRGCGWKLSNRGPGGGSAVRLILLLSSQPATCKKPRRQRECQKEGCALRKKCHGLPLCGTRRFAPRASPRWPSIAEAIAAGCRERAKRTWEEGRRGGRSRGGAAASTAGGGRPDAPQVERQVLPVSFVPDITPWRPPRACARQIRGAFRHVYASGFRATALRAAICPVHRHSALLPPPLYIQPQNEPSSPAEYKPRNGLLERIDHLALGVSLRAALGVVHRRDRASRRRTAAFRSAIRLLLRAVEIRVRRRSCSARCIW